ncbi:sensor histidine kinase [Cellulomonas telluris]|uniref:sensor histidine kinase n=1 Tax=Cellulomonas telluris TaxID=2306636 RepID=UPI0010A8BE94|nr:histidine kinase [Cellulomonas telluris]
MDVTPVTGPGARWDTFLTRLGARGPLARDALLAVVTAVVMLLGVVATVRLVPEAAPAPDVAPWLLVVLAVQSLALVLRRVATAACVVLVVLTQVGLVALAPDISVRSVAVLVVAATVGSRLPTRRALLAAAAAGVAEAVGVAAAVLARRAGADLAVQHALSAVLLWGAAVLVGTYLATRREHLRLLQERAAQLERERDARVQAAVADERARLARELHDVAAHHLSGMVVQAAAVERLVGRDPDAARAGAAWLRDQGRETLDNLRQVVGLLRGDEPDALAPVPGAAALDDLVAAARALGDDVDLERVGTPAAPLPPLADVSVYRVAQQALTNARQHAPGGPVRVRLVHELGAVVLEVVNGRAAPGAAVAPGERGGTGLAVMRERAALVGGTLTAGPHDGGWCVRLRVPVDDEGGRA